jgi:hypothetical protein
MRNFQRLSSMMAALSLSAFGCAGSSWGAPNVAGFQPSSAYYGRSWTGARQPAEPIADPLGWVAPSMEPAVSYGHLYVSAATSRAVYRFPLVNGLPSQPPDATITGFSSPLGIATNASGTLFVVDGDAHAVKVFANDQQGQPHLARSLSTSFYPDEITVTRNGYMIVAGNNTELDIYRETAKGSEPPIATMKPAGGGVIYALASDPNNVVYITNPSSGAIQAFANLAPPPGSGTLTLPPTRSIYSISGDAFTYGLTVHNSQIYARLLTHGPAPGAQYAIYPSNGNGFIPPTRVIATTACRPPYYGIAYGVLINNDLLYQACQTPRTGVFVYNSDAKRAVPIASVTGPFISPDYLAFAP